MVDLGGVGSLQRVYVQHPLDELLEVDARVADESGPDERQRLRVAFEHEPDRKTLVTIADLHASQSGGGAGTVGPRKHTKITGRTRTSL